MHVFHDDRNFLCTAIINMRLGFSFELQLVTWSREIVTNIFKQLQPHCEIPKIASLKLPRYEYIYSFVQVAGISVIRAISNSRTNECFPTWLVMRMYTLQRYFIQAAKFPVFSRVYKETQQRDDRNCQNDWTRLAFLIAGKSRLMENNDGSRWKFHPVKIKLHSWGSW